MMGREKGEIGSGGEGELEREAERGGLAESLLDPVVGGLLSVGKGKEVEKEGAGGGFLEVGGEGVGEVAESSLVFVFKNWVGGEKLEMAATDEGAGGGHAGGDTRTGGDPVDREEMWSGAGSGRAGRVEQGGRGGEEGGIVAEENGEREAGDVEGGVHWSQV